MESSSMLNADDILPGTSERKLPTGYSLKSKLSLLVIPRVLLMEIFNFLDSKLLFHTIPGVSKVFSSVVKDRHKYLQHLSLNISRQISIPYTEKNAMIALVHQDLISYINLQMISIKCHSLYVSYSTFSQIINGLDSIKSLKTAVFKINDSVKLYCLIQTPFTKKMNIKIETESRNQHKIVDIFFAFQKYEADKYSHIKKLTIKIFGKFPGIWYMNKTSLFISKLSSLKKLSINSSGEATQNYYSSHDRIPPVEYAKTLKVLYLPSWFEFSDSTAFDLCTFLKENLVLNKFKCSATISRAGKMFFEILPGIKNLAKLHLLDLSYHHLALSYDESLLIFQALENSKIVCLRLFCSAPFTKGYSLEKSSSLYVDAVDLLLTSCYSLKKLSILLHSMPYQNTKQLASVIIKHTIDGSLEYFFGYKVKYLVNNQVYSSIQENEEEYAKQYPFINLINEVYRQISSYYMISQDNLLSQQAFGYYMKEAVTEINNTLKLFKLINISKFRNIHHLCLEQVEINTDNAVFSETLKQLPELEEISIKISIGESKSLSKLLFDNFAEYNNKIERFSCYFNKTEPYKYKSRDSCDKVNAGYYIEKVLQIPAIKEIKFENWKLKASKIFNKNLNEIAASEKKSLTVNNSFKNLTRLVSFDFSNITIDECSFSALLEAISLSNTIENIKINSIELIYSSVSYTKAVLNLLASMENASSYKAVFIYSDVNNITASHDEYLDFINKIEALVKKNKLIVELSIAFPVMPWINEYGKQMLGIIMNAQNMQVVNNYEISKDLEKSESLEKAITAFQCGKVCYNYPHCFSILFMAILSEIFKIKQNFFINFIKQKFSTSIISDSLELKMNIYSNNTHLLICSCMSCLKFFKVLKIRELSINEVNQYIIRQLSLNIATLENLREVMLDSVECDIETLSLFLSPPNIHTFSLSNVNVLYKSGNDMKNQVQNSVLSCLKFSRIGFINSYNLDKFLSCFSFINLQELQIQGDRDNINLSVLVNKLCCFPMLEKLDLFIDVPFRTCYDFPGVIKVASIFLDENSILHQIKFKKFWWVYDDVLREQEKLLTRQIALELFDIIFLLELCKKGMMGKLAKLNLRSTIPLNSDTFSYILELLDYLSPSFVLVQEAKLNALKDNEKNAFKDKCSLKCIKILGTKKQSRNH